MDIDTTTPTNVTGPEWRNFLEGYLAGADGVILMYDITSKSSYERVIRETFARVWCCRDEVGEDGMRKRFGCVVVGNKADLLAGDGEGKREVDKQMAEEWAESQGFRACEVSSNSMEEVESVMGVLIDSVLKARRMDARDEEESRKEGIASLRDTLRRFVGKPTTST
jgi:GTPase SAR1 family protein